MSKTWRHLSLLACILVVCGCGREMRDQPRYEPLEASDFFADGKASRPLIEGTVARGHLEEDAHFYRGMKPAGTLAETFPVPLNRELLERGQDRFRIFCTPCHGETGNGLGMIVRRGFKQPTSFHDERLRKAPPGYFFDVITNGFGVMSSYAAQVDAGDRWAIAAYIRALQLSQNATLSALPPRERSSILSELATSRPAGDTEHQSEETH